MHKTYVLTRDVTVEYGCLSIGIHVCRKGFSTVNVDKIQGLSILIRNVPTGNTRL